MKEYRAGIDVGSTAVKLVGLDVEDNIITSREFCGMSTHQKVRIARESLAEAAIFEYAFRLGAKLTMEIHKDEE